MTQAEKVSSIRRYLKTAYKDDARLTALYAHAEDNKLVWFSCCCFIGAATADHALRGQENCYGSEPHYWQARQLPDSYEAECAFYTLGRTDTERNRRLIPIIRTEMRRRERTRKKVLDRQSVQCYA